MLNITSAPLPHSSHVLRLLTQLQLTAASYLEHYSFDPREGGYTDNLVLKSRDVEDLNALVRNVVLSAYADKSTKETLSRAVDVALTEASLWAKQAESRKDIVGVLEELQRVLSLDNVPTTQEALMARLRETPGLLERFKGIITGESANDYLRLTEVQRQLYDSFRQIATR